MYLLELAAQNVRGLSPTVRAPLKPGYLLLKTPAGTPAQVAGLIASLCYPDGRGGDAAFASPGQRAKVALTLLGNDQVTYRVIRELGGAGNLSRLNKASGAYEVVTEDSNDLAQFLRGQVGFPSKGTFDQLFTFTAAQLPSRRPKPSAAPAKVPLGAAGKHGPAVAPSLASAQAVAPASDLPAAEEKLRQLEDELALAKTVEEVQFRLDGITSQLFELESKLKGGDGLKAAIAQAEQQHAAAPSIEQFGLPPDIVQRAEAYPKLEARRDDQLAKLDAEGPASDYEYSAPPEIPPLQKDQRFVGSLVAGLVFLGLGLSMQGMARYVALLDLPAFTFAALLALRYVDDKESVTRTTRKGGMRAAREKKIREEFEAEASVVRSAMKTLNVESAAEIVSTLELKAQLLQKVEEYREQLRSFEEDPEYAGALEAQTQLRAQQEELNAELTEKGAYVREAREVEREVGRVRESIQLARSGGGAAPAAATAGPATPGEALPDPVPAVLAAAADLLQMDVASLGAAAKDRIAQYVAALTDRRIVGAEFDATGKATAVLASGARVPAGQLPPRDLDVLFVATRLTMIERVSPRQKVPVLIEDGLAVDEPKFSLLARMVKHLGTLTQVVHVTSHAAFAQAADAQIPV